MGVRSLQERGGRILTLITILCVISILFSDSPGSRNLLWGGGGGGRFTRGAAMYAKLFERRRGVQSAYDGGGGGGCSPLTTGGGGCSRQVTLTNSSITCTHSLLKHKEHHGKRVHSAPALSCSTASLTFVRTTELSGLLSMAQHVICRSLSSGRGGGGAAFHTRWEGWPPPPPRLCWIRGCSAMLCMLLFRIQISYL